MADYMVGSRGPEVQNIQRRLISKGYRLKADGNYSSQTSAAVKKFQFKSIWMSMGSWGLRHTKP